MTQRKSRTTSRRAITRRAPTSFRWWGGHDGALCTGGVHYHNYVVVGEERPEIRAEEGEKLCGVCFGAKAKMAEILLEGEGKDNEPSSESSSSVMEASESEA